MRRSHVYAAPEHAEPAAGAAPLAAPPRLDATRILALQRGAGNASVARWLARNTNPSEWWEDGPESGGGISGPAPPQPKDPMQLPSALEEESPERGMEGRIHFPVDVDTLDAQDQSVLRRFAERHREDIEAGRLRITIRGFADQRGDAEYNLGLSERRAKAVDDALRQEFARQQITPFPGRAPEYVSETQPRGAEYHDTDPQSLAYSRRVEIHVETWADRPSGDGPDPPGPNITDQWRIRIEDGANVGLPFFLSGEIINLRIEAADGSFGADFAFVGGGANIGAPGPPVTGGYNGQSQWVPFTTKVPVDVMDFGGFAVHLGATGVVAAYDIFTIPYRYKDENADEHAHSVEVRIPQVGFQPSWPGAGPVDGTLERVSMN